MPICRNLSVAKLQFSCSEYINNNIQVVVDEENLIQHISDSDGFTNDFHEQNYRA